MCALAETYRAWWLDVGLRRAPKTARQYRYHVFRAVADLPRDLNGLSGRELRDYLSELSRVHADVVQSALADYFGYLVRHGLRVDNPLDEVPRPRIPKRRLRRALSREELARLLIAAVWVGEGGHRWTGQRLAWTILAHYSTGARPGEFLGLSTTEVHLNGRSSGVQICDTKTGYDRVVPLGRIGREAFHELIGGRAGRVSHGGVSWYWKQVKRAMEHAEIAPMKARPYALRHSYATHLIERGANPRVVADLLGHQDLRHIWGYTVPPDDVRRQASDLLDDI